MRYKSGQPIPTSGIYTVHHQVHRRAHEVTLLTGEIFPRCAKCGDLVEFELSKAAPHLSAKPFTIHLYEIPDLDEGLPDTSPST
jgi:hypothetical protein